LSISSWLCSFLLSFSLTAQDRYEPILARIRAGDAASAESELKSIIKGSPGDAWARFYLGTLYATRRDYLPAITEYREAARLEPEIARFHLALGYAYRDIAQYDQAIQALRTAIVREPRNAEARFVLGAIYHLQEKDETARKEIESGLQIEPHNTAARLMLGDIYLTSGNAKAGELYDEVARREPKNIHAHLGLASTYALNPDTYDKAVEHLGLILSFEPKNFEARSRLGQLYGKLNRNQEAVEQLRMALALNPESASIHLALGNLLLKTGMRAEGERLLAQFKDLTARQQAQKDAAHRSHDLLRQGKELAWQNKLRDAIAKFNQVLEIDPDSSAAHSMLAKVYLSMRDGPRARKHITRALELEQYNGEYHYLLGLVLKEEKRYPDAILEIRQALASGSDFADAHNALGNIYVELGRYPEAVSHYQKAIELEPDEPEPHLNLASAYKRVGMIEESERELAIFRKLAAGNK
jgi:tetratricopeptide (TPR) repeat protein